MALPGHAADITYTFEDNGFNSAPNDTTFKGFGGNARLETYDASHQAERIYNDERYASEIVESTFDGAWSVTTNYFTEPPWFLAALFGQPSTSNPAGSQYVHSYSIGNGNDPVSLRLYLPTDGFNEYEYLGGCIITSITVDQSNDSGPEVSINGAYAQEPQRDSSLSPTVPDFEERSFTNRDAELVVDSDSVAKAQNTSVTLESNTELINEIGSENAVDFTPRAWEPSVDFEKIIATGQTVDPLGRWKNFTEAGVELIYDNGESGDAAYIVDVNVSGSRPNEWNESGRNDPDADLSEEVSEVAENASVEVTVDVATPPGV